MGDRNFVLEKDADFIDHCKHVILTVTFICHLLTTKESSFASFPVDSLQELFIKKKRNCRL